MLINTTVLNNVYKKEKDSNVKERILLVRRVMIEKQEASSVAENELNRSRWCAYKWLHRFDGEGLKGLKDKVVDLQMCKETMIKIRQEYYCKCCKYVKFCHSNKRTVKKYTGIIKHFLHNISVKS